MAGADAGEELKQGDSSVLQESSEAEASTQHESHGTNRGRVDTGLSLGEPHSTFRNRVGRKGAEIHVNNQNLPSAIMVLAERVEQGRNGIHHFSPHQF